MCHISHCKNCERCLLSHYIVRSKFKWKCRNNFDKQIVTSFEGLNLSRIDKSLTRSRAHGLLSRKHHCIVSQFVVFLFIFVFVFLLDFWIFCVLNILIKLSKNVSGHSLTSYASDCCQRVKEADIAISNTELSWRTTKNHL